MSSATPTTISTLVPIDTRDVRNVHRATRFCHRFLFLPTGGGNRLDYGMLRYTDVAWVDDRTSPAIRVRWLLSDGTPDPAAPDTMAVITPSKDSCCSEK